MYCGCPGAAKIGDRVGWLPGGGKGAGGSIRGLAANAVCASGSSSTKGNK